MPVVKYKVGADRSLKDAQGGAVEAAKQHVPGLNRVRWCPKHTGGDHLFEGPT